MLGLGDGKLKDYQAVEDRLTVLWKTKSKREVRLKSVQGKDRQTDYYLEVASQDKFATEDSMRRQFEERFEKELTKIGAALKRKGGIKKSDKVHVLIWNIYNTIREIEP